MDGIGLPIFGLFFGGVLFCICVGVPVLRRFALAALVSPFVSSVVFLFGSWILSDMNPGAEYGYKPQGGEHDPTRLDVILWLACVAATFLLSAVGCFKIQYSISSRRNS